MPILICLMIIETICHHGQAISKWGKSRHLHAPLASHMASTNSIRWRLPDELMASSNWSILLYWLWSVLNYITCPHFRSRVNLLAPVTKVEELVRTTNWGILNLSSIYIYLSDIMSGQTFDTMIRWSTDCYPNNGLKPNGESTGAQRSKYLF